jgi:diguanylate cyclase (GGDEF)-like protein/PAS domain S-box-containing protein
MKKSPKKNVPRSAMVTIPPGTEYPPKVLVIDDDGTLRLLARAALEKAGFEVDEAENGRAALDRVRTHVPDIVLLDVMMPEMDGFDTCAALRTIPTAAHVPVLMLTGRNDVESIEHAYRVGATDFATKPINYQLLSYRIRYILRGKRTADELRASEARLANAQRIARMGHVEWDVRKRRIHCSSEVFAILGLSEKKEFISDRELLHFVHPRDRRQYAMELARAKQGGGRYSIEHRIVRKDKTVRHIYQEGEMSTGPNGSVISATLQDITERRSMERKVLRIENFDSVTELPNRQLMKRYLAEAIAQANRKSRVVAVMAINVDHFARINDTLGHGAGDAVLRIVANRLMAGTKLCSAMARVGEEVRPDGDLVARSAGDEFVVVLTELESLDQATDVARRFMNAMTMPCEVNGSEVTVSVSIGISGFPIDGKSADDVLQHADAALHHAKDEGRNRWAFSSNKISTQVAHRFQLESDLRKALGTSQFEVHYQPKVSTVDESCSAVEALLRWHHPEHGYISPGVFIPVAEESGLIVPMSEWVIEEACLQSGKWRKSGMPPMAVAVNISSAQLRNSGLHLVIANALSTSGIEPDQLELELTESMLMEDSERNIRLMKRLRALGLSLSIDDFGTGHSSLSYLKRFPVNTLKIDQSFVKDMVTSESDRAIAGGIAALAHNLKLNVVAEGVESAEQVRILRELKYDLMQGYFYSKPLPAAEFEAWLKGRSQLNLKPKLQAVVSS